VTRIFEQIGYIIPLLDKGSGERSLSLNGVWKRELVIRLEIDLKGLLLTCRLPVLEQHSTNDHSIAIAITYIQLTGHWRAAVLLAHALGQAGKR
jgi:hypothetical protein